MKQLLEDVLEVLNAMPNRKLRGKDWTTYDLVKRIEDKLKFFEARTEQYFNNTTAQKQ